VGAAPALGTASVSLNTSALYISARRSAPRPAGCCSRANLLHGAGYVSVAFIALALVVVTLTGPRPAVGLST